MCPVRCLQWYLKQTEPIRVGRVRLFLTFPPSSKTDCSAADISRCIVGTVRWTCSECSDNNLQLSRVTAHEVRALSTFCALSAGVPSEDVIRAGTWRSANSFVSFLPA